MRTFIALAAVLVAFTGSHVGGKAPIPKDAPAGGGGIDGKYNLQSVSSPNDRVPAGAGFPAGGPGGGGVIMAGRLSTTTVLMLGPAAITKNEITLEGRPGAISPLSALAGSVSLPVVMSYTLDASKTPMTIDVETTTLRGKKTKQLGVVEVVNNRLILALAKEGD